MEKHGPDFTLMDVKGLKDLFAEYQAIESQGMPAPFQSEDVWKIVQKFALKTIRQKMAYIIKLEWHLSSMVNSERKHLCPSCNIIADSGRMFAEARYPDRVGNCLVLKTGKLGKFWGCEAFHSAGCKCTRDTAERAEEKLHNNLMAAAYRDAGGPF